jgi:hypothetical protein
MISKQKLSNDYSCFSIGRIFQTTIVMHDDTVNFASVLIRIYDNNSMFDAFDWAIRL